MDMGTMSKRIEHWILTFNRPKELNRLIKHLNDQMIAPGVFSNHPVCNSHNPDDVIDTVINTLNCGESNSWCARSWNTIFMKAFDYNTAGGTPPDGIVCIQDDTDIGTDYSVWLLENIKKYDFIWGPAGDQWFYISWDLFKKVGWWDERYIGCYCGDADWMKRVWHAAQETQEGVRRVSIIDTHNWGFGYNDCGLQQHVITTYESKTFSGNYVNQHWDFEKRAPATVRHSQALYRKKWGQDLDNNQPLVFNPVTKSLIGEIDWYPWFSRKHGFNHLYDDQLEDRSQPPTV
jgi:hypothetical protein